MEPSEKTLHDLHVAMGRLIRTRDNQTKRYEESHAELVKEIEAVRAAMRDCIAGIGAKP